MIKVNRLIFHNVARIIKLVHCNLLSLNRIREKYGADIYLSDIYNAMVN